MRAADSSGPPGGNPFEGLKLDNNGDLVDTKTGKALNDFGATRFDVAVRAMRGEMSKQYVGEEVRPSRVPSFVCIH